MTDDILQFSGWFAATLLLIVVGVPIRYWLLGW